MVQFRPRSSPKNKCILSFDVDCSKQKTLTYHKRRITGTGSRDKLLELADDCLCGSACMFKMDDGMTCHLCVRWYHVPWTDVNTAEYSKLAGIPVNQWICDYYSVSYATAVEAIASKLDRKRLSNQSRTNQRRWACISLKNSDKWSLYPLWLKNGKMTLTVGDETIRNQITEIIQLSSQHSSKRHSKPIRRHRVCANPNNFGSKKHQITAPLKLVLLDKRKTVQKVRRTFVFITSSNQILKLQMSYLNIMWT